MNLRKFVHFSIGPIIAPLFGLVSLPLISWFFSQEDIGRLAMIQVINSFGVLFCTLGLDHAYIREYHETKNKHVLLKTLACPGIFVFLIASATISFFSESFSEYFLGFKDTACFVILLTYTATMLLTRYLSLILRMQEHGKAFSVGIILPRIFLVLLVASYAIFDVNKNYFNLLIANFSASAIVFLIFFFNLRHEIHKALKANIDYAQLKIMLRFGLPMIVTGLAYWILVSMDRLALKSISSLSELANYSVASSFGNAASIFETIFCTIWAPIVYKAIARNEDLKQIDQIMEYLLAIIIFLFAFAGIFSKVVICLLPSQYTAVQYLIVSCIVPSLFYTFSEAMIGVGAARKNVYLVIAILPALLTNAFCMYYLIPKFGARGAAVSTAVAFYVLLIIKTEFSIYFWRRFPRLKMYSLFTLSLFFSCIYTLFGDTLNLYFLWPLLLFIACVFFSDLLNKLRIFVFSGGETALVTNNIFKENG